jgi:oligopeptide/dipeptide ABC transporter ATP-binding protein
VQSEEANVTELLAARGLTVRMPGANAPVTIVDHVDFTIVAGEVLGVAGESGSGKTMTMLSILGLQPPRAVVTGEAHFNGRDLLALSSRELRDVRGNDIAIVFQDPMTTLHPMLSIEQQLTEHMLRHLHIGKSEARSRAIGLLEEVRIPNASKAIRGYPHHFSGGMRQRIVIAMALACEPQLLIADEPTTALDVTVQAGILQLLDQLRRDRRMGVILVTHDLGVLSSLADRVSVFYAGRIAEEGQTADLLQRPQHPYTMHLLMALPDPALPDEPLVPIPGVPATPEDRPPGCAFHPRCAYARPSCVEHVPQLAAIGTRRLSACPVRPFDTGRDARMASSETTDER